MQWSKLKKSVEERFAESLKGRVELRCTTYRHSSCCGDEGRGWIAMDGQEIYSFSTQKALGAEYQLEQDSLRINGITDFNDPRYAETSQDARRTRYKQGLYTKHEFIHSLQDYLALTITEAVKSENPIVKGIAMLDRRFGKRKLKEVILEMESHPLVKRLRDFRSQVEGICKRETASVRIPAEG